MIKSKGIRILDDENNVVSVKLPDILEEIQNGDLFYWSILYLDAIGSLSKGRSIPLFQDQIYESKKGLYIDWNDLCDLSKEFHQIIDITVIGCSEIDLLRRYQNDQEMYESCDIVIEMIDSGYWEVFSKDHNLINRLASKFRYIKFLETDFEK